MSRHWRSGAYVKLISTIGLIPSAAQNERKVEPVGYGRAFAFALGLSFVAFMEQRSRLSRSLVGSDGGETTFRLRREINVFLRIGDGDGGSRLEISGAEQAH